MVLNNLPKETKTVNDTSDGTVRMNGAVNVRDLGGHQTSDGRTVVGGRLYRSDSLARLTDDDLHTIAGMGLRLVVDFRTSDEIRIDGDDRLPDAIPSVHRPVGGGSVQQFYGLAASGNLDKLTAVLGGGGAAAMMRDINRGFVVNDAEREEFAATLRNVADNELPMLFHCTAGKDRTGWMAALLLTILGVDRDTVIDDYMASNRYYLPHVTSQLSALKDHGIDPELFMPVLRQSPEYLLAAFEAADEKFGGMEGFITEGLGLDSHDVTHLRSSLLVSR